MGFWGVKIKPKRPYFLRTEQYEGQRLHISQATLGLNGKPNERSIVKCKVGDGPGVFICSLNPGGVESCSLDLYFEEDVIFSVSGSAPVYLSGYYMDLEEPDEDSDDEGSDEDYTGVDDDFIVDDDFEEDDLVDDESEDEGIARPSSVKIVEVTDDEQVKMEQKLITAPSQDAQVTKTQEDSEDDDGFAVPSKRKGSTNEADKVSKKTKSSDDTQSTPAENQSNKKKKKKKQKKTPQKTDKGENDGPDVQMKDVLANGKENGAQAGNLAEGKQEEPGKKGNSSKKGSASKKFPNGLEIGELSMGKPDGKQAKPGKKVVIHYIGKLKSNGKFFDSTVGRKPFQFRLGINEVVKGFDIGVTGMRVGDKRRITIPPSMGYGAKAVGEIPPNSWLVFYIELVDVKG